MKPELVDEIIFGLATKKAEEESAPDQERQWAEQQFGSVVQAMVEATTVMVKFLNEYKVTVKEMPEIKGSVSTPDIKELAESLAKQAEKLQPAEGYDDSHLVKSISDLAKGFQEFTKEFRKLKFDPQITVQAAEVHVPAVDLTEVKTAIEGLKQEPVNLQPIIESFEKANQENLTKMQKMVKELVSGMPGTPMVQTDPLVRFTPTDIDDSGTIQYFGFLATDTEWFIRKFDTTAGTIRFTFGKGIGSYSTNWAIRATLTYTLWSQ